MADGWYSSPEAALMAGITYRELDYWCRRGAINPNDGASPGSGRPRRWTPTEVEWLIELGHVQRRVRAVGLVFTVEAVGEVWTALQRQGYWHLTLEAGQMPLAAAP